jgi:hypothetical protein
MCGRPRTSLWLRSWLYSWCWRRNIQNGRSIALRAVCGRPLGYRLLCLFSWTGVVPGSEPLQLPSPASPSAVIVSPESLSHQSSPARRARNKDLSRPGSSRQGKYSPSVGWVSFPKYSRSKLISEVLTAVKVQIAAVGVWRNVVMQVARIALRGKASASIRRRYFLARSW